MKIVTAKQIATTEQNTLVNQVSGGEKNIIHRIATISWSSLSMPGHVLKCLPFSSISSGMADSAVVCVSTLKEYLGLDFSIRVVNFLPPGPVLTLERVVVVVIIDPPGELLRDDLAIFVINEYKYEGSSQ